MKVHHGKTHKYLGMTLDFSHDNQCRVVGVYIVMVCPWTDHILARNLLLKVEADLS